jgi:hypothetical protein
MNSIGVGHLYRFDEELPTEWLLSVLAIWREPFSIGIAMSNAPYV